MTREAGIYLIWRSGGKNIWTKIQNTLRPMSDDSSVRYWEQAHAKIEAVGLAYCSRRTDEACAADDDRMAAPEM